MSFSFTYPYPEPSTKGWGPGWPDCQTSKIVADDLFVGGVREEILELVTRLVTECERRGFKFVNPGCWGFACRAKKTSSGGQGSEPSVHSWGLAIDINAPRNVFGAPQSSSEIATKFPWLPPLMKDYGFYWLGPPIGDWMHFHFAGSPADAKDMLDKARKNLLTEEEMSFAEYKEGWQAHKDGKPLGANWNADKKFGWNARNQATTLPKPEPGTPTEPHTHPHVHGQDIPV
jgi:hypothetical protein